MRRRTNWPNTLPTRLPHVRYHLSDHHTHHLKPHRFQSLPLFVVMPADREKDNSTRTPEKEGATPPGPPGPPGPTSRPASTPSPSVTSRPPVIQKSKPPPFPVLRFPKVSCRRIKKQTNTAGVNMKHIRCILVTISSRQTPTESPDSSLIAVCVFPPEHRRVQQH